MTDELVIWRPKEAALRDLIRLTLFRKDGRIIDLTGHVASQLRKFIGIPDSTLNRSYTSTVMQKMVQAGLIERRMSDGGRRTQDITMVGTLTMEQVQEYEASEADNKSRFMDNTPISDDSASDLYQLVRDCDAAYAALRRMATADSTRADVNRRVALNVAVDPLAALTDIAERLAKENAELRDQLRAQKTSHSEEMDGLNAQIRELMGLLGERQEVDRRASAIIARYGNPSAMS